MSVCSCLHYFLVKVMLYWLDDVALCSVLLNKCLGICIDILICLYTVKLSRLANTNCQYSFY